MNISKGKLLIAEPTILNDSSFNRSLILLTEHTEESSVGFILNRPLPYTINDLIPEINCNHTIYQGGPVEQDNLYFIHRVPELLNDSTEVDNGIYWGGNFNQLSKLLNKNLINKSQIRFFLGYSGWGNNQIKNEIDLNSWFIANNTYKNILNTSNEDLWRDQILIKGGNYKIWANAPSDIQMN